MHIKVKELPVILQNALEGIKYFKTDIEVKTVETVSLFDAGCQGYQGFSVIINLETGETVRHNGSWGGANMFNSNNRVDLDQTDYAIPLNAAVIKGSRGEHVFASLYVSSANFIKALDAPKIELTRNERGILKVIDSTKASYRKDYIFGSYYKDYFDKPLSEIEYRETVNVLASKGLVKVNKAGAVSITTNGKNLV